ncbi:hypothetical protein [Edaphovirga cremea]|uniref:hypothetical protein n=1 Tax=Edaphovirga cremea TaxID=2267246 RepID=UPI003989E09D
MGDFIGFLFGFALVTVVVIGGIIGVNVAWVKYSCENYSTITGVETKSGMGVCFLKVDGTWIRREEYKIGVQTNQKTKLEVEVK